MKKLGPIVLSLFVAGVLLAGCSKTLNRADVRAEMTKSGIPESMADCVTDKMIAKFGLEKLSSNGDLSAEEKSAATQIGADCALAGAGVTTTTAAAGTATTAAPTP